MIKRSRLDIDWSNKKQVIELAVSFGKGFTVYKHPHRVNYAIVQTHKVWHYMPAWIVYQT